jgi:hypothetical protein
MLAIWFPDLAKACEMAFIMCAHGAEWNEEHHRQALHLCEVYDERLGAERQTRRQWRASLCVCVHHWAREGPQAKVPTEVVARGAASMTSYLADIARSGADDLWQALESDTVLWPALRRHPLKRCVIIEGRITYELLSTLPL